MIGVSLVLILTFLRSLNGHSHHHGLIMNLGKSIERVDVFPYHDLGKGKYKRLGHVYPIEKGISF